MHVITRPPRFTVSLEACPNYSSSKPPGPGWEAEQLCRGPDFEVRERRHGYRRDHSPRQGQKAGFQGTERELQGTERERELQGVKVIN